MNKSIAIVDDEPDIVELITYHLKKENFKVNEFYDGESLLSYIENYIPDLIILDLMLPEIDGLEICRILKKENRTSLIPIIMLTAKGTEIDKVVGLELGADDYIVKPFSPRELVARVKAVLRRGSCKEETSLIQIGKILEIDLQKFEVSVENIKINLTSTEFKVLKLLTKNIGWVYSRNQILDYLWGNEKIVLDRTIDVHIKNLREKLGKAGKFIKNIRSIGYKIEV
jgi:two-component system phosphate regulon response regulator PhoB/two-component system alkaline phosphatase synthesis response regulator PhoP